MLAPVIIRTACRLLLRDNIGIYMHDLSDEHKQLIIDVFNQVATEYEDDNRVIFLSEADRAKHKFTSLNQQIKLWKRSKYCMVPGCNIRSIKRSHTIPSGMSLSTISEDGRLLTPLLDQHNGKIVMTPVGIGDASTFPGFCHDHEQLFKSFETRRKIDTKSDILLQTYRTACRELFRTKFLIEQHTSRITAYCRLRDERLLGIIKQRALERGFPREAGFTEISFTNDPIVSRVNNQLEGTRELGLHIEHNILHALQNAIFSNCEPAVLIHALNIDFQIPVALSGCASFAINDNGERKEIYLLMCVIPCVDHSIIIFCGDIQDKAYIKDYVKYWTSDCVMFLSMIESWMINGTDQWYIKPSIWNALATKRQTAILHAMAACEQNIGEDFGLSIFDDIRIHMLSMLKDHSGGTQDVDFLRFVEIQKAKMSIK